MMVPQRVKIGAKSTRKSRHGAWVN